MKTAVIYARYSSDAQSEQSIEGQMRVCNAYAEAHDLLIVKDFVDRAMTGMNDARPAFQQMLHESKKKQWEVVLVYKLDRFSRNKYESTIHKKTLRDRGIAVVSAITESGLSNDLTGITNRECPSWIAGSYRSPSTSI